MPPKRERYLNLRGLKYWFKRDIPEAIRPAFEGRTAYLVNLETGDLRVARVRRDEIAAETERLFADVRSGKLAPATRDHIRDLGEQWARELKESLADPLGWTARVLNKSPDEIEDEEVLDPQDMIEAEAERIGQKHGSGGRARFLNIAQGRVPVDHHLEAYLSEAGLAAKTTNERRSLVKRFATWAAAKGMVLPDINRSLAGEYVTTHIANLHRRTGKKHLGSVKLYWDYLTARGLFRGRNPWEGQVLPARGRRVERGSLERERAFTTEEMRLLLYADYPSRLRGGKELIHDAMRVAALSGMRLAEIITLWAGDCEQGDDGTWSFHVQAGKTFAAARRVPIHPELLAIVKRRRVGKQNNTLLFHELTGQPNPADTFGKRFATYRAAVGVDDKREARRRSLVNFHSFRRWFVTEAERADQPLSIIARVVGHELGGSVSQTAEYSGGTSELQNRRCVEAVELPGPS